MNNILIRPMREEDLPAVTAIEKTSMSMTWSQAVWMGELKKNQVANHVVACVSSSPSMGEDKGGGEGGGITPYSASRTPHSEVVGYAGCWIVLDEANIVNIAVSPEWRRKKIGERLMEALLKLALEKGAKFVTLEVRESNEPAKKLYEKFGFTMIAMRKAFYQEPLEDAHVYWLNPLVIK